MEKLKTFAETAVRPYVYLPLLRHGRMLTSPRTGLQPIKYDDFAQIARTDEAFFLFLQTFETSISDLASVDLRHAMFPKISLG